MEDYSNVVLVKLSKDRVVVIEGEKFLAVDTNLFNTIKSKRVPRPYVITDEMQNAIVEILTLSPGLGSGMIWHHLDASYDMQPSTNVMRGCLQRMKEDGKIRVQGTKNKAIWFLNNKQ